MKKFNYFLSLFIMLFLTNCNKSKNLQPSSLDKYDKLSTELLSSLNYIADDLRAKKANFDSKDIVEESVKKLYKNNNDAVELFKKYYIQTDNKKSTRKLLSIGVENEIETQLQNSETPEDFLKFLNTKFEEVNLSNIESSEKDYLLQSLIIYKVSTEFLCKNIDLVNQSEVQAKLGTKGVLGGKPRSMIWWERWGKCAAGTIGGAGLGALGGMAAGSAVPVVGTIAGGIAGAIFGGLGGASAGC